MGADLLEASGAMFLCHERNHAKEHCRENRFHQ
jgi:hypothetical protein